MKKNLLILVAVALAALPFTLRAEQLSVEQSLARLRTAQSARRLVPHNPAALKLAYTFGSADERHFYAFNRTDGGGYLLVGADDLAPALLASVDGGSFSMDKMAPSTRWWLDEYDRAIARAIATGQPLYASSGEGLDIERQAIAPLVTATWGQVGEDGAGRVYFNGYCPKVQGEYTVTGCVATAMAQIMYYHKWPERGVGRTRYTTSSNQIDVTADFSSAAYDWAAMQDHYGLYVDADGNVRAASFSDVSNEAVSLLQFHCGAAVQMDYGVEGSSSNALVVPGALINNFSYDKGVIYEEHDFYTDEAWQELLYAELTARRPILYTGGTAKKEGHAFVCDGYRDGLFHINWGWNGMSDGYYAVVGNDCLHPRQQGTGGSYSSDAYTKYHTVILGIQPPVAGSVAPARMAAYGAYQLMDYETRETKLRNGSYIYMECPQGIFNTSNRSISLIMGVRLVNTKDGSSRLVYDAADEYTVVRPEEGFSAYAVICSGIPDGTYKAYPVFLEKGSSEWQDVRTFASIKAPTVGLGEGYTPEEEQETDPAVEEGNVQMACASFTAASPSNTMRQLEVLINKPVNSTETAFEGLVALLVRDRDGKAVKVLSDDSVACSIGSMRYASQPLALTAALPSDIGDGFYEVIPVSKQDGCKGWLPFATYDYEEYVLTDEEPVLSFELAGDVVTFGHDDTPKADAGLACSAIEPADGGNAERLLSVRIANPANAGDEDFDGEVALAIVNEEGQTLMLLSGNAVAFTMESGRYTPEPLAFSATLPASLGDGHYWAVPYGFQTGSTNWTAFATLNMQTLTLEEATPRLEFWLEGDKLSYSEPAPPTEIHGLSQGQDTVLRSTYDLQGRRTRAAARGLYVVGRRKVLAF